MAQTKVLLPVKGKRNILITSALPYVNNVPHLGNIVGSVLSADVFARYSRLRGENVIYICGTDEYGTATETKALQEGVTPQELCDKYFKIHTDVYEWFDIEFDKWGRTTTKQQTEIAHQIFNELNENGYILENSMDQLFCSSHGFLADRYVSGTCPLCSFSDARGDQCDGCGRLLNAVELLNPRCKYEQSCTTKPEVKSTSHLFLDLAKINDKLCAWIEEASKKGDWSQNSVQVTHAWIKEGLKPRCITRDLKWGTSVPLQKFENKVFYVWFDAPIGYISITANYTTQWEEWWKNPDQVQLYQFMGKDNIPFHTVMFPASLIGGNTKWTTLHSISTTEYLNYEGEKFSKSRGIGVFGLDCAKTGIPPEVWRYYLLTNRPETSDSNFNWDDLVAKNNNELIANLGNFVNRATSFAAKEFDGQVPPFELTDIDNNMIAQVNQLIKSYNALLEKVQIKEALRTAMKISSIGNQYLQDSKPWELVKQDKRRCGTVVAVALNLARLLGTLLEPYMPAFQDKVLKQLNWNHQLIPNLFSMDLPAGHQLGKPDIIFKTLDEILIPKWRSEFGGQRSNIDGMEESFPLDLRGAIIREIEDHPTDGQLFLLKLDLGSHQRQAVARLKSIYKPEELLGKRVVTLCNLPTVEIGGAKSEAMILVAEGKKKDGETPTKVLQPQDNTGGEWAGVPIVAEGLPLVPKVDLTLKAFQKMDLKLSKEGHVVFNQKHILHTADNVKITAPGVEAGKIK